MVMLVFRLTNFFVKVLVNILKTLDVPRHCVKAAPLNVKHVIPPEPFHAVLLSLAQGQNQST